MEGNGVGFILGSLHFSLARSLSDGQKTNRSFEKKKETGEGGGKAEAKISTPQGALSSFLSLVSLSFCRHDHKFV